MVGLKTDSFAIRLLACIIIDIGITADNLQLFWFHAGGISFNFFNNAKYAATIQNQLAGNGAQWTGYLDESVAPKKSIFGHAKVRCIYNNNNNNNYYYYYN